MAVGVEAERSRHCRRCRSVNQAGDKYCQRCGASLSIRDITTRYLCAAAQLSEKFADLAIKEFLVEPYRAVPQTPGVDSTAVLREAVAARTRRRIRDGVLLVLQLVLLVLNPVVFFSWLVVAVGLTVAIGRRELGKRGGVLVAVLLLFVLVPLAVLGVFGLGLAAMLGSEAGSDFGSTTASAVGAGVGVATIVLPVVAVLLIAGVLAFDEFAVHFLVFDRFRANTFVPNRVMSGDERERRLRGLGQDQFAGPLGDIARVEQEWAQHPGKVDVVVHRGFSPFVGAGIPLHQQVITLPLEPADDDAPTTISVLELQAQVSEAMLRLRGTSSLGPGRRLEDLTLREQVLIPADRLVADPEAVPGVLPGWYDRPAAQLDPEVARDLADASVEWARYYRCYRIESWDRDLTTSCYLHVGTNQRMLFLEWQFFALLPIDPRYRTIDQHRAPVLGPLRSTFAELCVLPATILQRAARVFRPFKALPQRPGEIVPAKYGADRSLRELAQADRVQSYFQDVDVERYVRILDSTLFRAVGAYLQERGYSVVEFTKLADPVHNSYDLRGSTLIDSAVGTHSSAGGRAKTTKEK
ncbi:hypothetical protein DMA12_07725 [Amycolatopsis balhimycina DSM 5908]|uniref:Uncharacterized protein n=1 Tax=Amycolatopsis balhimycina DSM 5908 TaxID=1081091 RepID=A0A428WXP0_AMYBA|nr:hypothetical protein [Amycolatopsis balhimycina]RSM47848.1 hypothetical protein DMA12_07725 [Amycolatopsis balhimycina DSM 5908]